VRAAVAAPAELVATDAEGPRRSSWPRRSAPQAGHGVTERPRRSSRPRRSATRERGARRSSPSPSSALFMRKALRPRRVDGRPSTVDGWDGSPWHETKRWTRAWSLRNGRPRARGHSWSPGLPGIFRSARARQGFALRAGEAALDPLSALHESRTHRPADSGSRSRSGNGNRSRSGSRNRNGSRKPERQPHRERQPQPQLKQPHPGAAAAAASKRAGNHSLTFEGQQSPVEQRSCAIERRS
jgi:hypothetical protein